VLIRSLLPSITQRLTIVFIFIGLEITIQATDGCDARPFSTNTSLEPTTTIKDNIINFSRATASITEETSRASLITTNTQQPTSTGGAGTLESASREGSTSVPPGDNQDTRVTDMADNPESYPISEIARPTGNQDGTLAATPSLGTSNTRTPVTSVMNAFLRPKVPLNDQALS
jgi:hypothetical protein